MYGCGDGPCGSSYAVPTKDASLNTLRLDQIEAEVSVLLRYMKSWPSNWFWITRIGCGLAGYTDEQIAPMFRGAPPNCSFAEEWRQWLEAKP